LLTLESRAVVEPEILEVVEIQHRPSFT